MQKSKGRRKRPLTIEKKLRRFGYVFMAPWILGLVFFFIIPFCNSMMYSFNQVSLGSEGLEFRFLGWDNYRFVLLEDADFVRGVTEQVAGLASNVPIILIFSVFIAALLNQKFRGRLFARSLFFIPVIIASGLVIEVIQNDVFTNNGMRTAEDAIFQVGVVQNLLENMDVGEDIIRFLTSITTRIFDLTWKSGVQILLFLSAFQRIPPTYYEVASVEGANAWEAFWKITFPAISPMCLLVTVYTIIDTFTDQANQVMSTIIDRFNDMKYGYASASAAVYFVTILAVLGVVLLIFRKRVQYT